MAGTALTQDAKKDTGKVKGQLPPGWKGLPNLTADQTQKIYGVQNEFKAKISDLEDKIKELRSQERTEMTKFLTAEQKAALAKISGLETEETKATTKDAPKDVPATKEKSPEKN